MADPKKRESFPAFYKSLFDNMLDGLAYGRMIFDAQGHPIDYVYLRVNKSFEHATGLKNVIGKKVTEVIPGIARTNPDWLEAHGRVATSGTPEKFETYLQPLARWFFVSLYSTRKNFFVAVFQDITDRKRTEQDLKDAKEAAQNVLEDLTSEESKYEALAKDLKKFKLALDNSSENVLITDREGIVIYANKAIEKTTGYTPKEVIGKKSGVLWAAPMPPAYYGNMWKVIKKQKKFFLGEIQNRRKSGELYTSTISISPILNKRGDVEFFVGIERDITKEREVDRAKNEFMSLASHQHRTPPSIIGWYTEALQSGDLGSINPKQAEYLNEIYKANQRMVGIINSLLNISRIEMGTFSVVPREINIRDLIEETTKELSARFSRNITLKKDYGPKVDRFRADPTIMQIVIDNLLSNAFKYSPPENTEITIVVKVKNNLLLLSVQDNGVGIPEKDQGRVFEKLFRADNAVVTNPDGTGLGLYMTKRIVVEGLGGKIWFDSKENQGATFYLSLPLSGMKEKPGSSTLARIP